MKLSEFKFDLPSGLIALYPAENRDEAKMMVVHRDTEKIEHKKFKDIVNYFGEGDVFYCVHSLIDLKYEISFTGVCSKRECKM